MELIGMTHLKTSGSKSSVHQLLMDLIELPSVNPAFCQDPALAGEWRVADYLEHAGKKAGLSIRWQTVSKKRKNLILVYKPRSRTTHRLLLAPHMDTVVASGEQLKARTKLNRIHGRGACDTKGSIAAMLDALRQLIMQSDRPKHTEIHIACLVDEEHGQLGSRVFAAKTRPYDLAIVGEPTSNRVVTAHKGVMWFQLHTQGKAAHGSRPSLGVNAIASMAEAVRYLEGEYREHLNLTQHSLLGAGTINVGTVQGGKQPNIVPDACSIWADRRTLPGESYQAIQAHLLKALKQRGVQARMDYRGDCECPALETDSNLPWVQELMQQVRQKDLVGVDYFCDAAVIAQNGTPCVVFGPGSIDQAHTRDEWISIRSLESCVRHYFRFFQSLP